MADVDDLFMWEDFVGRDFTLDEPCGLWCSIGDWVKWLDVIQKAEKHTDLALADLQKTGSRRYQALADRMAAWKTAFGNEPQTINAVSKHDTYAGDTRMALDRLIELGKQLRSLLLDIDAATKDAGAVSKVPGSSSPAPGGFFGTLPWWAWLAIGYLGYKEFIAKGNNGGA